MFVNLVNVFEFAEFSEFNVLNLQDVLKRLNVSEFTEYLRTE